MPKYSDSSLEKLAAAHPQLQKLFQEVIKHIDCSIIWSFRSNAEQQKAYDNNLSNKPPGKSKHNLRPSLAIDVAPCPINWEDSDKFYYFGGFVCGMAAIMGISIRWGGDWDGDGDLHDQTLMDLGHFELLEE